MNNPRIPYLSKLLDEISEDNRRRDALRRHLAQCDGSVEGCFSLAHPANREGGVRLVEELKR